MRFSVLFPLGLVATLFVVETVATEKFYELSISTEGKEVTAYITAKDTPGKPFVVIRRTGDNDDAIVYHSQHSGGRSVLKFVSSGAAFKVEGTLKIDGKSVINLVIRLERPVYEFTLNNIKYLCGYKHNFKCATIKSIINGDRLIASIEPEPKKGWLGTARGIFEGRVSTNFLIKTDTDISNDVTEFILQVVAVIKMRKTFDSISAFA